MSDDMMDGSLEDFRAACLDALAQIDMIPRATLRALLVQALRLEGEYARMLCDRYPEARQEEAR